MNQTHPVSVGKLFKLAAQLILLGLITFSIVRNVRGLDMEFAGVSLGWQIMIAVTITLASSVLTGSSVLIHHSGFVKTILFLCGIMFSVVSFFLNFSGTKGDMKNKYKRAAIEDPQVIEFTKEIEDIIDRANVYGISDREKSSLLQREKELRQDLRIARERAVSDAQHRSRKEELNIAGIVMFAALPEIGIITFTIVIVLLSYQSLQPIPGSVHTSVSTNGHFTPLQPGQNQERPHEPIVETGPPSNKRILTKYLNPINSEEMNWNPFS